MKQESQSGIQLKITTLSSRYNEAFDKIGKKYNCDLVPEATFSGIIREFDTTASSESKENFSDITKEREIEKKSLTFTCADIKKYYQAEKNLRDVSIDTSSENRFTWPAQSTKISTYFRDSQYYSSLGSEHDAIDIVVPQGTDIIAPAAGYVYYTHPPTPNGYAYIALKHADGYVTVYGHVSEILVDKFEYIKP